MGRPAVSAFLIGLSASFSCVSAAAEADLASTSLDISVFYSFPNREAFGRPCLAPVEYGAIEGGAGDRNHVVLLASPRIEYMLIGVLLEAERYVGDVARMSPGSSSGGWGSDAPRILPGPALDFDLGGGASAAILLQFMASATWSDATAMEEDFASRGYEGLFWCFHRAVFDFTLEL